MSRDVRPQEPVTFDDAEFGTFALDRNVGSFEAATIWNGAPVTLDLSATAPDDVAGALRTARALWADARAWDQRVREFAARELLPIKNDAWLDEGEAAVGADEFRARMDLETIGVRPDGSFEFWFDDDDLFWGHAIQVCGSVADGPTDADIPG